MRNNPFVARFDAVPSLVAPEMQGLFESCLHQAVGVMARLEAATDEPRMEDDFWFAEDDWRAAFRPYIVRDGLLLIPVKGVLLHDFPYQLGSWATGYAYILRAFVRGLDDANVKGIALICHSPGGEAAGCIETADKMYLRRGEKPVRSFAAESAYSSAYAIASVADSITVSRTGGVGSIGVITAHVDLSGALEQAGVKITFVTRGKHKKDGNPYEPLPKDVEARIQARIDELGEIFESAMDRNRGMEPGTSKSFEALTFTATQAVSNGLADSIGSLDDAVAAFVADLSTDEEDEKMTEKTSAVDQAAVTAARAEGVAEGRKDGETTGLKAGMIAERARINAIIGSEEGKKRPIAALSAALKTDMTAEQANAFLADLPEEKKPADPKASKGKDGAAADFQAAMDKSKHPELGAPGDDEEQPRSRADRAFELAGKPRKKAA